MENPKACMLKTAIIYREFPLIRRKAQRLVDVAVFYMPYCKQTKNMTVYWF